VPIENRMLVFYIKYTGIVGSQVISITGSPPLARVFGDNGA